VMICHTMSAQVGAIEEVVQAVKSGKLSQDGIQASVDRVKDLKARVCISSYDDSHRMPGSMRSRFLDVESFFKLASL
jgi:hypothetical protein